VGDAENAGIWLLQTAMGVRSEAGAETAPSWWRMMILVLPVLILLASAWMPPAPDPGREARRVCLLFNFLSEVIYASVVPESLDLATAFGAGATYSGMLIGITKIASFVGALTLWGVNRLSKDFCVRQLRPALFAAAALHVKGVAIFAVLASGSNLLSNHSATSFLVARAIIGLGGGVQLLVTRVVLNTTCPIPERGQYAFLSQISYKFGFALAPCMVTGVGTAFRFATGSQMAQPGLASGQLMILASATMVLASRRLPRSELINVPPEPLKEVCDDGGPQACSTLMKAGRPSLSHWTMRRIVIVCCIAYSGFLEAICSALEVVTAMILQQSSGWTVQSIGLAVSMSIIPGALGMIVYMSLYHRMTRLAPLSAWMKVLTVLALIFSLGLFPSLAQFLGLTPAASGHLLVSVDTLLYMVLFLGSGMCMGLAADQALPSWSYFSIDCMVMYVATGNDGLARFVAPILGKSQLRRWGQSGYAMMQLAATLAMCALACVAGACRQDVEANENADANKNDNAS